ncbi:MAG: 50S ribosomal protein L11 methyltransferase [Desulfuromonadales bacterium]
MNESWLEIACNIPAEYADELASFLTDLSGNGVCMENICVDAFSPGEIPDSLRVTIKAYLPADVDQTLRMAELETYLQELSASRPGIYFAPPVIEPIRSEDWSTSWKIHFKPLRVGKRLLIVPTWEEAVPMPDDLLLRIDPGMAFGTGGHETTQLCLELLEKCMDSVWPAPPSLLDLGTGSGILAMAASLLGAGRVLALDIDPDALLVARENLAVNGLAERVACDTIPLELLTESFDIILANILAEELVRLASCLAACLNPGGILILSGILIEKEELVHQGFAALQLQFIETGCAGEWVAMLYRRAVLP